MKYSSNNYPLTNVVISDKEAQLIDDNIYDKDDIRYGKYRITTTDKNTIDMSHAKRIRKSGDNDTLDILITSKEQYGYMGEEEAKKL